MFLLIVCFSFPCDLVFPVLCDLFISISGDCLLSVSSVSGICFTLLLVIACFSICFSFSVSGDCAFSVSCVLVGSVSYDLSSIYCDRGCVLLSCVLC